MHVEDQASRAIYVRLRHRARVLRGLAVGFVALIPLTLAFGAIPYFLAGDMALNETRAALEMRRSQAEQHAKSVEKQDRSAVDPAGSHGDPDTTVAPATAPGAGAPAAPERTPPAQTAENGQRAAFAASDEALSAAVIRITAVVLLIALVYVFGSLYRYSMRLASYYDEKADALRLLEAGDRQLEERLSQVSVPDAAGKSAPARSTAEV
ncbi:MAG TPA: hypothetical protein VML91_23600 [Burkholderiales bacterium]|nr:hypothetical protein [Burkholderiales bacterium]